jgi:hypothetical protein
MTKESENGAAGRKLSGKARMAKLTPEQRKVMGKEAAAKRWQSQGEPGGKIYRADAWGVLPIIGHAVPCAVIVEAGEVIRVVSERELVKSLGGKRGGSHWLRARGDSGAANLPPIISATNLRPFISQELLEGLNVRYPYKVPGRSGAVANGIRAELYPMICDVLLKARDSKALLDSQDDLATSADILMRALAHTGIIALVDEATGYQTRRAVDGLARILEAFIAKELQPYVPTFEPSFYEQLFRLRGLDFKFDSVKRPQYFGYLTNDIIYKRLAPGVLAELKKVTPRNESGQLTNKYFQRLTANIGYPKLRQHLGVVEAVMKLSTKYTDFIDKLDFVAPRYGQNYLLRFDGESDDSGL